MTEELRWGVRHATPAYAVLNACRATRYAHDGQLCSKVDGAEWYLARHPGDAAVAAALGFQRHGDEGPTAEDAARFVGDLRRRSNVDAPPSRSAERDPR
jgi:hypothetical protein